VRTFVQYLLTGLATGSAFALVATGFVFIHRVTRVVNFAQGGFAVVAGFVAYRALHAGLPHGVSEALAVLIATGVGVLVGLVAVGRRGTPVLASLMMTIGLGIFLYAVEVAIFGDQPTTFEGLPGVFSFAGISIQRQYGLIVLVTATCFLLLGVFFAYTYLGKVFTACASNAYAARLSGIDVTRFGVAAFGLGGALGGVGGVILMPLRSFTFDADVEIAINGFAAAIFGGLNRPGAALVGGLILGVAEALVAGYARGGAAYQKAVSLPIILAILIWQSIRRPAVE
jgi:branched-chain amino acid transport system permease protein